MENKDEQPGSGFDDGNNGPTLDNDADTGGESDIGTDMTEEKDTDRGETSDTDLQTDADADADIDTGTGTTPADDTDGKEDDDTDTDWEMDMDGGTIDVIDDNGGDAGDEIHTNGGDPQFDKVYLSTPNTENITTVVGLAGAVSLDSRVIIETDDETFVINVGREGGFAQRFEAKPDALVTMIVTNDSGERHEALFVTGALNEQFSNGIVADGSQSRLTEHMLIINGAGDHLDGGYFVVGGNITRGTSGIADVLCDGDACRFSLNISAAMGDALDIFLIRNVGDFTSYEARAGTVVETLIAQ
jgi:hypothetical protein